MAKKKKASLIVTSPMASEDVSAQSNPRNESLLVPEGGQKSNPAAANSATNSENEELVYSNLVHSSAGMIPKALHDTIIALNQSLGLTGEGNLIPQCSTDSVFRNSGHVGVIGQPLKHQASPSGSTQVPKEGGTVKEPWVNLFAGAKLASKGAPLEFVTPLVKDGKKVAQLQQSELATMADKWQASLVMYVVGESPTLASVRRFMAAVWSEVSTPQVFFHDEGYFIIRFECIEDKNRIVAGGPYTFYGKPVIIKPWAADFNFYEEVLKVIPLWVKFPNLPLHCWGSDSLSRISSLLGVPLCADECTTKQERVSFARVLIEMDITTVLPDHVWIEDARGVVFKQAVVYDWKPLYCKKCNTAGHDCTKPSNVAPKPAVKKVWVAKPTQQHVSAPQQQTGGILTPHHDPPVVQTSGQDWNIVTRRTRGPSRMRNLSPSNPFTVLSGDLGFKEISGEMDSDGVIVQNTSHEPHEEG